MSSGGASEPTLVCFVCRRERPERLLTGRRCTNRLSCIRYGVEHAKGRVIGRYKRNGLPIIR